MSLGSVLAGLFGGGSFGSIISGALGMSSSALGYAAQKEGMKSQFEYNKQLQQQSYGFNHSLQHQSYKYNRQLAKQSLHLSKNLQQFQNDYTTMMSNSAHQREVADLRAAGLNPILSANTGASTPSAGGSIVGSGSVGAGSVGAGSVGLPDFGDVGSSAIGAYLDIKHMKNETNQTDSTVATQKTQQELNESTSWRERKQASYLGEQARNEAERYDNIIAEREKLNQDIVNSKAVTAATVDYYKKLGDSAVIKAVSDAKYNSAATIGQEYNNTIYKRNADFYDHGYGKFIYGLGQTTGAIGNIFGGHLGVGSTYSHLR